MKIGYSCVDITPDLGVELSGYGWFPGRKAERVLDSLYARAVAFEDEDNNKSMLLINCDLVAIDRSITDIVKQQISDELGIDKASIMIVCTHTHTGPATGKLIGCGEPDEKYLDSLPELLVNAGKMAYGDLRDVRQAKSIVRSIEPIGFNRVLRSDGPVDNNVRGIAFYFDEGRPLALVSYGCHPVTLGPVRDISADFPGRVVKALNKEGFDAVFLTGFCGDIDPVSNLKKWGSGTSEVIDEYGKRIADGFIRGLSGCEPMGDLHLDAFDINIKLKLQQYNHEDIDKYVEYFSRKKEENPGLYRVSQIWAEEIKRQLKENADPYIESLTIQVFRIGDVVLVGFPGEIFTMLGTIVKEAVPHMNIITIGNANTSMRYIPTRDDIENKGYAGFLSCLLYLKLPLEPGEGERMAEMVAKVLKERL